MSVQPQPDGGSVTPRASGGHQEGIRRASGGGHQEGIRTEHLVHLSSCLGCFVRDHRHDDIFNRFLTYRKNAHTPDDSGKTQDHTLGVYA